jgi:hypothetical protein
LVLLWLPLMMVIGILFLALPAVHRGDAALLTAVSELFGT